MHANMRENYIAALNPDRMARGREICYRKENGNTKMKTTLSAMHNS